MEVENFYNIIRFTLLRNKRESLSVELLAKNIFFIPQRVRCIVFGEQHSQPRVLLAQHAMLHHLALLAQQRNEKLVMVMEMFNLEQQNLLDAYSKGEITAEEIEEKDKQENFNIVQHYSHLLNKAKEMNVKVYAGFPPRPSAKKAVGGSQEIWKEAKEKEWIQNNENTEMNFTKNNHFDYFKSLFRGNNFIPTQYNNNNNNNNNSNSNSNNTSSSSSSSSISPSIPSIPFIPSIPSTSPSISESCANTKDEDTIKEDTTKDEATKRIFPAQVFKEVVMANKINSLLDSDPQLRVFVICGCGHSDWRYGVPDRIKDNVFVISSKPIEDIETQGKDIAKIKEEEEKRGREILQAMDERLCDAVFLYNENNQDRQISVTRDILQQQPSQSVILSMLETLEPHVIASILNYIEPQLLSFVLPTCSSWYKIICNKPLIVPPIKQAECAAFNGHLCLLQHIMSEKQIPKREYMKCFESAAGGGQIEILEYFISQFPSDFTVNSVSSGAASVAASYGQLSSLIFLHKRGYKWDYDACHNSAAGGYLNCLEYLHSNGCKWTPSVLLIASARGHLDCVKYAHENGCPGAYNICYHAAESGQLACLKYGYENGCGWDSKTTQYAAFGGRLECLKYAHENGCPWNVHATVGAAEGGHLECLVYLHENGCEWSSETLVAAARKGHMDCLRYAIENGCPKDDRILIKAAQEGQLEALIYAHQNGCEMSLEVCVSAVFNRHLNCLKYAHENGCKLSSEWYSKLTDLMHYECVLKLIKEESPTCEKGEDNCNKSIECFQYLRQNATKWNIRMSINLHDGRKAGVSYDPIENEYLWHRGRDLNFTSFISYL